jgi:hypothetical protein
MHRLASRKITAAPDDPDSPPIWHRRPRFTLLARRMLICMAMRLGCGRYNQPLQMALQPRQLTVFPLAALMVWAATPGVVAGEGGPGRDAAAHGPDAPSGHPAGGCAPTNADDQNAGSDDASRDGGRSGDERADLGHQPVLLLDRGVSAAKLTSGTVQAPPEWPATQHRPGFDFTNRAHTARAGTRVIPAAQLHRGVDRLPHGPPLGSPAHRSA